VQERPTQADRREAVRMTLAGLFMGEEFAVIMAKLSDQSVGGLALALAARRGVEV
jgi:hypothetical protein